MIEIATSISFQENLVKTGIVLRGLVAYFLSWAFPRKQQGQGKDPEGAEGRSRRKAAKNWRAWGDNWRNNFFRGGGGAGWKPRKRLSNRCWASQKWNWSWEWASLDREQTTVDAGTQTVNSDFKVKIQTRAATQTDEFEYLFKETVVQPSTEEGAVLHWFRRFWRTVLLARLLIKRAKHWFYFKTFLGF